MRNSENIYHGKSFLNASSGLIMVARTVLEETTNVQQHVLYAETEGVRGVFACDDSFLNPVRRI